MLPTFPAPCRRRVYGLFAGAPRQQGMLSMQWLDPTTAFGLGSGVIGPGGQAALALPTPRPLGGLVLMLQAVTFHRSALRLSTPTVLVLP